MARRKTATLPKTELNITSMMDLVLNLLMFFVLVSNFAMAEMPQLTPPDPTHSRAQTVEAPNKITINILPGADGKARLLKVGVQELTPEEMPRLSEILVYEKAKNDELIAKKKKKADDQLQIDLRADKSLRYSEVQPVMAAITNAGIARINIVAALEQ